MPACCERVHDSNSPRGYACSRSGVVAREGRFYCKQHDPDAVAARHKARNERWQAEWAEKQRRTAAAERLRDFRAEAVAALRLIAAGHNDPRSLAAEIVTRFAEITG